MCISYIQNGGHEAGDDGWTYVRKSFAGEEIFLLPRPRKILATT